MFRTRLVTWFTHIKKKIDSHKKDIEKLSETTNRKMVFP